MFPTRWLGILALYLRYRGRLDCARGVLLSNYLVVLLVLLAVIIGTMLAIVCVSMRGKKERLAWRAVLYPEMGQVHSGSGPVPGGSACQCCSPLGG